MRVCLIVVLLKNLMRSSTDFIVQMMVTSFSAFCCLFVCLIDFLFFSFFVVFLFKVSDRDSRCLYSGTLYFQGPLLSVFLVIFYSAPILQTERFENVMKLICAMRLKL